MTLSLFEDRARTIEMMRWEAMEDGSVRLLLREPMNVLTFLPEEIELVKTFLEIR